MVKGKSLTIASTRHTESLAFLGTGILTEAGTIMVLRQGLRQGLSTVYEENAT